MAQFNVDSEVIAAKSAQATILRRIHHRRRQRYDRIPARFAELLDRLRIRQLQGVLDQWHATQRQVEASITQINEALTRAGVNYADTEQANASMFVG